MDTLAINSFTQPIDASFKQDGLETSLVSAFQYVFESMLQAQLQDLIDYGCPHIGSRDVVERFAKKDGLVVLRRDDATDRLMQIIFSNWSSMASARGLTFVEFVLTCLWQNHWTLTRLWHDLEKVKQYPRFLTDIPSENTFLTSRVNLYLSRDVALKEIIELSPIVRRLVPAHIVLKVIADELNTDIGDSVFGITVAGRGYHFFDLS
ncbi:hypothetical protein [Acinetobacter boissieri]|uniref:Uncharacterized protein n=1 Tax=Acinetobacter boissieri TaxID=1219383 RepID=A0A1G6GYX5_9GAMM|nr:hypothetical protein [Acinetobacter boissieri]SDB86885.1 hypothetical protein SAMN05421733_10316 [Acinetobacter boissieri]